MPKPVLQAMVLAEHVYQDRMTGKFVIAGTFATIFFGQISGVPIGEPEGERQKILVRGPITQSGSPYLYLALFDVHGQVPLNLKLVDLSDASVLFEVQILVASTDPVSVAEYILPMPLLPVHKATTYSLDLFYEEEILGSWRITAKKIEGQNENAGEGT
jgi:hypothetical protein